MISEAARKSFSVEPMSHRFEGLMKVLENVTEDQAFRWSRKGVPHLLVETSDHILVSICWFQRSQQYKLFYPYTLSGQHTWVCQTPTDVVDALRLLLHQFRHRALINLPAGYTHHNFDVEEEIMLVTCVNCGSFGKWACLINHASSCQPGIAFKYENSDYFNTTDEGEEEDHDD